MDPERKVSIGQTYKDRRGSRHGGDRVVKVIEKFGDGPFPEVVTIQNTATGKTVDISGARLLDKSRFSLVSEVGALAPAPQEGQDLPPRIDSAVEYAP